MIDRKGWCTDNCGPGAEVRRLGEYDVLKCRHHGRFQVFSHTEGIISINHKSVKCASSQIDREKSNCGGY